MSLDEALLRTQLNAVLAQIAAMPRNPDVGYQGIAEPSHMGLYAVFRSPNGTPYVADPAELVDRRPDVALREWITVRGDQAGGRETVKPGGGGLDVVKLLTTLGGASPAGLAPGFLLELLKAAAKR